MAHVPWSEEDAREQKYLESITGMCFTEGEAVMTEKMDGSNAALTRNHVYVRSHGHEATHRSFDMLKARHAEIAHELNEHEGIYGEWCYAEHSIHYDRLPSYFLVFGVLDFENGVWSSWDATVSRSAELGFDTVPEIRRGAYSRDFETGPEGASASGSVREGYVIRTAEEFAHEKFERAMAKCVRHDHVSTDEHWSHSSITTNELADPS